MFTPTVTGSVMEWLPEGLAVDLSIDPSIHLLWLFIHFLYKKSLLFCGLIIQVCRHDFDDDPVPSAVVN